MIFGAVTDAWAFSSKKSETPAPGSEPELAETRNQEPETQKQETVWVGQPDGSLQCKPKSGKSLEDGKTPLTQAGVAVLESKKTSDGMMRAQMCGIPTGKLNAYLIKKSDLPAAIRLGFATISED